MIDVNSGEEKLHINLDITLYKSPCDILSLDIVDVTGVHVVDIEGKLVKHRLNEAGEEIGIIQHIDDDGHTDSDAAVKGMDAEYRNSVAAMAKTQTIYENTVKGLKNNEGCKMSGFVWINKVPGNFHISGHHYPDAVQKLYMAGYKLDFSHKINHLSFGNLKDIEHIKKTYNEKINFELDGRDIPQEKYAQSMGMGNFGGPSSLNVNYFLEISQVDYVD